MRLHSHARALAVAEVLLVLELTLLPLSIGGVFSWSVAVATGLGIAAAACVATEHREIRWPIWAAFAVALFVGLQAVPLPPPIHRALTPRAAELLDLVGHTGWRSIAIDPAAACSEMVRLLGFAATLFAASRLAANRQTAARLATVIGAMAVAELAAIVFHRIIGTNRVYGLVSVSNMAPVLGTFATANPLSAYLGLAFPVVAALAVRSNNLRALRAWWTVAGLIAAAVLLAGSRSGLVGLLVGATAVQLLLVRPRSVHPWRWAGIGAAALAVGGLGIILIEPNLGARFASLLHPIELSRSEEKIAVWRDIPGLVRAHWVTGVGRGSFEQIFPMFKHHAWSMTYSHVECAPLQALADLGLLAGGALILAWVAGLIQAARRAEGAIQRGAVAALFAISAHDLGDFSLEISTAVGVTTAVLWGVAFPAGASDKSGAHPLRAALFLPVAAVAVAAFVFGARHDLRRDLAEVERASRTADPGLPAQLDELMARHPAEPWFALQAADAQLRAHQPSAAMRYLNRAQTLDPTAWRGHALAAEALLQARRRDQALLELRLAYKSSGELPIVAALIASRPDVLDGDGLSRFAGDDDDVLAAFAHYLEGGNDRHLGAASELLLEHRPNDPGVRLLRARVLVRERKFAPALAIASALPLDEEVLLLRIASLDGLGRAIDAETALAESAPHITVGSPEAGARLAERALRGKLPALALSLLERCPATGGVVDQARLHRLRGEALEGLGPTSPAVLHEFQLASRLDPSESNRLALGAAYERAGLMRQALLEYRSMVRTTPHPSPEAEMRLARLRGELQAASADGQPGLDGTSQ